MKSFTFLHLTDFHAGVRAQDHLWPNIQDAFFKDLELMHSRTKPWHAILFTGDLVQSGQKVEYNQLEKLLLGIVDKIRAFGSEPVLFAVPGNHDLTRPAQKDPAVRMLAKWNDNSEIHEEFWTDPQSEYREVVKTAFAEYEDWKAKSLLPFPKEQVGMLPGDRSAIATVDGESIGLVGLNTAFLQLTEGDYYGKLAWDQRQVQAVCEGDVAAWTSQNRVSFLLSHHGVDWLNSTSQRRGVAEIAPAGRFGVHFFGHMHSIKSNVTGEGGGNIRHFWQGKALFGLENYGQEQKEMRLHGYSVGSLGIDGAKVTIRQWPRRARLHQTNGWEIIPDHESFSLQNDEGTQPLELPARVSTGKSIGPNTSAHRSSRTRTKTVIDSRQKWDWPSNDPVLAPYCAAVCKAHSQIRFVEIPYLKDVSDVDLDTLFVEPRLSENEIHPDMSVLSWPKSDTALSVLSKYPQTVLLGDPGTGKSTLVSCLSWELCRPQQSSSDLNQVFFGLVPLPMILRELNLKADLTWETLVQAFLEHRIGKLLNKGTLELLLKQGRALVLLDGLDEIGNLTIRRKLKVAVHAGMATYPKCRWIMTSRIVGYEQVPFHFRSEKISITSTKRGESLERTKRIRADMARVFYHVPFNDEQIRQFSLKWYSQHESESEIVSTNATDFVEAVRENQGTQRLARIPYLLTLMALVHHKHARLPHGRTELYERIATAYLESIDVRRRLDQLPYSLSQKKRWLADIAFRMQLRRNKQGSRSNQANLLASKLEVQKWLKAAMSESGAGKSNNESEELLRYFAQRSGLLVPRGEGKFAFMHLSLQEYFAATFLEPRLTASRFSPATRKAEPTNEQLKSWVNLDIWRETFVLLFELLSAKSTTETEGFLNYLFDHRLNSDKSGHESIAATLLAELVTDSFVVLSSETARKMKQLCWRWAFDLESNNYSIFWTSGDGLGVVKSLVRETNGDLRAAWKTALITQAELRLVKDLNLAGCSNLSDLKPISQLRSLTNLNLADCIVLEDLTPLEHLKKLKGLSIERCPNIKSLDSVSTLRSLEILVLGGSNLDLNPLARLGHLEELHLHHRDSEGFDLTPIANLSNLKSVCTVGGKVRITDGKTDSIKSAGVRTALSEAKLLSSDPSSVPSRRRLTRRRPNSSKKK